MGCNDNKTYTMMMEFQIYRVRASVRRCAFNHTTHSVSILQLDNSVSSTTAQPELAGTFRHNDVTSLWGTENGRGDVGEWCDAVPSFTSQSIRHTHKTTINADIFILHTTTPSTPVSCHLESNPLPGKKKHPKQLKHCERAL